MELRAGKNIIYWLKSRRKHDNPHPRPNRRQTRKRRHLLQNPKRQKKPRRGSTISGRRSKKRLLGKGANHRRRDAPKARKRKQPHKSPLTVLSHRTWRNPS